MRTKALVLLTLMMVLLTVTVTADKYTQKMTLKIENGIVYIENAEDDIVVNASHDIELPVVVEFDIDDRTVCEDYLKNITTQARCDLNSTQVADAVSNSLPEAFADQQSFFMQTVVPQQTTLDGCETDKNDWKNKAEICSDRLNSQIATLKFVNQTKQERIDEVNGDRSTWNWLLWGLLIANILLAGRQILTREMMKRMSRRQG